MWWIVALPLLLLLVLAYAMCRVAGDYDEWMDRASSELDD